MTATAGRSALSGAANLVDRAERAADPFARAAFAARARRVLDAGRPTHARADLLARLDRIEPRTGDGRAILGGRPYPGYGARIRLAGAIEGEFLALALLEANGGDILSPPKQLRAWLRAAVADLVAAHRYCALGERGEQERARFTRVLEAARRAGVAAPEAERRERVRAAGRPSAADERTALARELGVDLAAAPAERKRALRDLAKRHHPDLGGDGAAMAKVARLIALERSQL